MHIRVERDAFVEALGPYKVSLRDEKSPPDFLPCVTPLGKADQPVFIGSNLDVGLRRQCS